MPDEETNAAERLERDPRPKGKAIARGPVVGQGPKADVPVTERPEDEPAPWTEPGTGPTVRKSE